MLGVLSLVVQQLFGSFFIHNLTFVKIVIQLIAMSPSQWSSKKSCYQWSQYIQPYKPSIVSSFKNGFFMFLSIWVIVSTYIPYQKLQCNGRILRSTSHRSIEIATSFIYKTGQDWFYNILPFLHVSIQIIVPNDQPREDETKRANKFQEKCLPLDLIGVTAGVRLGQRWAQSRRFGINIFLVEVSLWPGNP